MIQEQFNLHNYCRNWSVPYIPSCTNRQIHKFWFYCANFEYFLNLCIFLALCNLSYRSQNSKFAYPNNTKKYSSAGSLWRAFKGIFCVVSLFLPKNQKSHSATTSLCRGVLHRIIIFSILHRKWASLMRHSSWLLYFACAKHNAQRKTLQRERRVETSFAVTFLNL